MVDQGEQPFAPTFATYELLIRANNRSPLLFAKFTTFPPLDGDEI